MTYNINHGPARQYEVPLSLEEIREILPVGLTLDRVIEDLVHNKLIDCIIIPGGLFIPYITLAELDTQEKSTLIREVSPFIRTNKYYSHRQALRDCLSDCLKIRY